MNNFDLIVAWNVLERSYRPAAVPAHLLARLQRGGILLIGGHFDYSQSSTPKDQQLTGSFAEIQQLLGGPAAVDALNDGAATELYAAYPHSETTASLKTVRFFAFRKK